MKSNSLSGKLFDLVNHAILIIFSMLCLFPFIYVISYSLTPYQDYLENPLRLIPSSITFQAYKQVLSLNLVYTGFGMTLIVTVLGTLISVFLLCISAYPLTKKDLKGRNLILGLILFTMFFNGGVIPNYLLVRSLGLLNTPWSLILPGAISVYNLIIMKSFISTIPESLEESAIIDGANEITVLFRIILPLCTPIIATFVLFSAVGHWNSYFNAVMYITKRNSWPLMVVLREMVVEDASDIANQGIDILQRAQPFTIKMAVIIVTAAPIFIAYPFVQRFFTKGMLIGSVKG